MLLLIAKIIVVNRFDCRFDLIRFRLVLGNNLNFQLFLHGGV